MTRRRYKKFVYDDPPKKFTGEQLTPKEPLGLSDNVREHVQSICKAHKDGVEACLNIATACANADKELRRGERTKLLEHIPLTYQMFTKYVRIGKDKRLFEPGMQEKLPPSLSTLYLMRQLTDEQFEQGFENKILGPKCTRQEVQKYKNSFDKADKLKVEKLNLHAAIGFKVIPENADEFNDKLRALAEKYGAELVLSEDVGRVAADKFLDRYYKSLIKAGHGSIIKDVTHVVNGKSRYGKNPKYKISGEWNHTPDEDDLTDKELMDFLCEDDDDPNATNADEDPPSQSMN